jgi:MGT family glycosyltransferase
MSADQQHSMSRLPLHYLIFTWDGAGNHTQTIAIVQQLTKQGHRMSIAGYDSQRSRFDKRGFRFILLEQTHAAVAASISTGVDRLINTAWCCKAQLKDVPTLVEREKPDRIIVDCMMYGALTAVEKSPQMTKISYILVHTIPGGISPPGGHLESWAMSSVNEMRVAMALEPVKELWDTWKWAEGKPAGRALVTSVPELDPLAPQLSHSLYRWIGPQVENAPPSGWISPWAQDDRRPFILVSFSTEPIFDGVSRIQRTLTALADQTKYRVLVTSTTTSMEKVDVPNNAVIVKEIPHSEILPLGVDVVVTHAGHGTISIALQYGLLLVCLPFGADQPTLAQRVEQLGAGVALDGEQATPEQIRDAVQRCIMDPSFKIQAKKMSSIIANMLAKGFCIE